MQNSSTPLIRIIASNPHRSVNTHEREKDTIKYTPRTAKGKNKIALRDVSPNSAVLRKKKSINSNQFRFNRKTTIPKGINTIETIEIARDRDGGNKFLNSILYLYILAKLKLNCESPLDIITIITIIQRVPTKQSIATIDDEILDILIAGNFTKVPIKATTKQANRVNKQYISGNTEIV
jgi:hypothetical protein